MNRRGFLRLVNSGAATVALMGTGLGEVFPSITWFNDGQDLIGVLGAKCDRRGTRLPPALKVLFGSNQTCIIPLQVYVWEYKSLNSSQRAVKKKAASGDMSKLRYIFQRAYSNYIRITFVKVAVQ